LKASRTNIVFDAQLFLDSSGLGRTVAKFRTRERIFSQGAPGTHVMYIQEGGVKLAVVNTAGKEVVVEILGPGDFFWCAVFRGRVRLYGDCDRDCA